ncbi:MAG TPA: hypothetical protein EYP01_00530 [Candidatus Poseidoniales archaeon]|nr:hypothetical protein [Candidatus Poseidoniales archaeon]HIM13875.1 hypothetical protein [Candidatus Poseidoniales archaeon]HIM93292.1 hypothetical protein [Candidatus Poseidoniales archaeon]
MARRGTRKLGLFGRLWESQKDRHFQIITYSTILSVACLVWGFVFLFVLGGYGDPEYDNLVPWSWLALVGGLVVSFYLGPEFFVYMGQRQILEDILMTDSRPEVLRRRKEAEDAADMLGKAYQARLMGLYQMHNVEIGKKYRVESVGPIRDADSPDEGDFEVLPSVPDSWWNTSNSMLSKILPGLWALRNPTVNRGLIAGFSFTTLLLLSNSMFGLFTGVSGERDHTLDLTASIHGMERVYESSPHFDAISLLFIAVFATLMWSTRPRVESPASEEE